MTEERMKWELEALQRRVEENRAELRLDLERVRTQAKADSEKIQSELKKEIDLLKCELETIGETTKNIEKIITESNGIAKALRWTGGVVAFAVTAVLSWMRLTGKG